LPELTISGTLEELLLTLESIKTTTSNRKVSGWSLFQPDEEWEYRTSPFSNVCPKCTEFGSQNPFFGPTVGAAFPDKRRLGDESTGFFHPEVHITYPQFRGQCRCRVEFLNIGETLVNRLDMELRGIV
jgi:hypothetical protein